MRTLSRTHAPSLLTMEPQPAQDPAPAQSAPSAAADGEAGEKQQYRDNGTRGGNKRKWQQNKFQHGKGGKKRDTGRAEYLYVSLCLRLFARS